MAQEDSSSFETPDGALLSASQIDTWRLCKRKWAWSRLDRIEGAPNIPAEKGSIVHEVLEAWLKDGTPIDPDAVVELSNGDKFKPGAIAAPGLKFLPVPKSCGTERNVFVRTPTARYQGYIDFDVKDREVPIVGDHKSTSDFKWAKTVDDLKNDAAATIYAASLMVDTGKDIVELHWIYYRTKGRPKAKLVKLTLSRTEVERNFTHIDATAAEILEARKTAKTALDLEPNPHACDAYGGCPFRENCNLSTMERMKAIMAQESLAEKMARRKKEKAAAAGKDDGKTNGSSAGSKPAAAAAAVNAPEGGPIPMEGKPPAETPPAGDKPAAETPPAASSGSGKRGRSRSGKSTAAESTAAGGFTLFIDCQPVKGLVCIPAGQAMSDAHREVCEKNKVEDYRLVDFGKGPGMLAVALDKYLTSKPLGAVGIFCDTRTAEGRDTVNVFEKHASTIVRAVG